MDASELKGAFMDVDGIGDARADELLAIVAAQGYDTGDELKALLEDALDYHEAGEHAYAEKFVRRALDAL